MEPAITYKWVDFTAEKLLRKVLKLYVNCIFKLASENSTKRLLQNHQLAREKGILFSVFKLVFSQPQMVASVKHLLRFVENISFV